VVSKRNALNYDTETEVKMQQNKKSDCDAESLIRLLYLIADALQICEENSAGGLESTKGLCQILATAQFQALALLGRVTKGELRFLNASIADCTELVKREVLLFN
jgi:hypothetical protein